MVTVGHFGKVESDENRRLSHAQCLICGFHTSCADKARALSRHFLLHKTNGGFNFDSEIDTAGKLLNAVENGYLRFLSPSPTLRPPILKTEVKRYIDLDQGRVDFVEKFFKCAACNYLAVPAKGIASKNFADHLTQKTRTTSDDGHDLVKVCAESKRI